MRLFARKKPSIIDTFYIIDFDRCLGRADAFQGLLEEILQAWPVVDLATVRHAHEEVKKTGGSFDNAQFIRRTLNDRHLDGDAIWHQIETTFFEAAMRQDMFESYAKELLGMLDAKHAQYGILTFGGEQWQTIKLKVMGLLAVSHMIVSNNEKGKLIASWQQPDGTFIIPAPLAGDQPQRAKRVAFVDDKPVSFVGIPERVFSICVNPNMTDDMAAELPAHVIIVKDMAEAAKELETIDKT